MTKPIKKKKTKSKKKILSAAEKTARRTQRAHTNLIRGVFRNTGFVRFSKLADKYFELDAEISSDFDDIFVYENLVVCAEYTTSKSSNVGDHIKKKKIIYDHVKTNPTNFLQKMCDIDGAFKDKIMESYNHDQIIIQFVYCSRYDFDPKYKVIVSNPVFLDYPELRYFKSLTDCIKRSARPELLDFLNVPASELGQDGVIETHSESNNFPATLLPEANSNFDPGYKVVSFYADAKTLLDRAYVLRRQGWKDSDSLYQRMISKAKIASIRKHLKSKKRVFVNNIIATLDDDTKIVNEDSDTVNPAKITQIEHVTLQLPGKINTVGLIDGQHRTFSYYESSPDDSDIAKLRKKQNLLVTGIIYPEGTSSRKRETFEARLFLEINSTQTNAKSDLKQAINRIVVPFSDESIASSVVDKLGRDNGPLGGHIVRHWFDTDKLKTTSVVSYGMKPLVKTSGTDTLFAAWDNIRKNEMVEKKDDDLLDEYIDFCVSKINEFLTAVKKQLPNELWTPARSTPGRLLTTTVINSLLICFRFVVQNKKVNTTDVYEKNLMGLSSKDFEGYHSSQYAKLAVGMYEKYFEGVT